MFSFTRRRLIVVFVFLTCAVFAGVKFTADSRAAKRQQDAVLAASVTATMTAAPTTDVGGNGAFVNPGDTLRYSATITNGAAAGAGNDANNTVFTDNLTDGNLTLIGGSIKATPIAFDDLYTVTGNVRISKAAGTLLANDINPINNSNANLVVSAIGGDNSLPYAATSAQGGQVTASANDGSFQYNPPPGFEGTGAAGDSFTYTVTDTSTGLSSTTTGTVKLDVSGMIWFVQAGAAAGGDGRLTNPFNCFVGAGCYSGSANDPGDNIFLYSGAYTGGQVLKDNQKLIGQGASSTLISITGLTLAANSDTLPTTGGANPTITTGGANAITLAQGNTIRGLTIGDTAGGTKIFSAGPFGTFTVGNNTTPDVTLNGTGKALDLTNGTFAATSAFSSVATTSSATHGMQLITVGGTVAFGSTSVSGSTNQGIYVNNSSVNLNFGNTTVGATGGSTECIRLETNTGGTRTFGTLGVTGCTAQGITISGGGNVLVTGQTTVTNPGSTGILISSTPGGSSVTFANVTDNGSGGTGVDLGSNAGTVTFADLDIAPAAGQRAFLATSNTGLITSTSGTVTASGHPGPFAISGVSAVSKTPLALAFDSISVTGATNVGVNVSLVSGNMTVGTTTISGGAGNLVGLQVLTTAAGGTMNFGNTSVTGTNSIAGVRLGLAGQGNAGAVTFGALNIAPDSGNPALLITDGTGTTTSTSGTITTTAAQAVNVSASVLAMTLDSVSASGGTAAGVNLTSATGSIVMNGGTLTGNASGPTFLVNSGSVSATYKGGITQANNAALLSVTGGHNTGTLTFNTGTINATNGTGLQFDNADGIYTFGGTTTLNGGDAGIDIINGSSGTFNFGASTSITNPSGIAYFESTGAAGVTYNGTISQTNAQSAVKISNKTGGSTTFLRTGGLGGQITASTTTANAIDLDTIGGTINFNSGLAITTTSGIGFRANAVASMSATQNNAAIVNTILSTTGTALSAVNSTIGGANLNFRSINSGAGANNGITLDNTGASGGLTVTGNGSVCTTGTPTCDGGIISGKTGSDGSFTSGNGIYLNNTSNVSLTRMSIQGHQNHGIRGNNVTGFILDNSLVGTSAVNGTSNTADVDATGFGGENSIRFYNLLGSATISNSTLDQGFSKTIGVANDTGSLNRLTITNCTVRESLATATASDSLFMASTANAIVNFTINGASQFSATRQFHLDTSATGTSTMDIIINGGNAFSNSIAPVGAGGGMNIQGGGTDSLTTFNIDGNSFRQGSVALPPLQTVGRLMTAGMVSGAGKFDGKFTNNTVGVTGVNFSGGGNGADGIGIFHQGNKAATTRGTGTTDSRFLIQNNVFKHYGQTGVQISSVQGNGVLDATVIGNTMNEPGSAAGGAFAAIWVNAGALPADTSRVDVVIGSQATAANKNTMVDSDPNNATDVFLDRSSCGGCASVLNLYRNGSGAAAGQSEAIDAQIITDDNNGGLNLLAGWTNGSGPTIGTPAGVPPVPPIPPPTGENTLNSSGSTVNNWNIESAELVQTAIAQIADNNKQTEVAEPVGLTEAFVAGQWDDSNAQLAMQNVQFGQASMSAESAPTAIERTDYLATLTEVTDRVSDMISPTVYSQEITKESPESGTVTVNGGSAAGFTIPAGKSTTIIFDATIANPTTPVNTFAVSTQGSVVGTGFGPIATDGDPVAAGAQATSTVVVQPPTITKSFSPATILLDQQSTLTLTINNTNPAQAVTGITVTDAFPANLVVASPLTASTTCTGGALQDSGGGTLAPGDVGIKLITGTRNANQSCTVTVKVSATIGGSYANTTGNVASFEGFVGTTASSTLTVGTLTASTVSVSGRVLGLEGRGLRDAIVTITDQMGNARRVRTGPMGVYRFDDVQAGQTYILGVGSRRYIYAPRVVVVADELTDVDFTPEP